MANAKIQDLTALVTPVSTDVAVVVHDPSGTPSDRSVTLANLSKGLNAGNIPNTPAGGIAATDIQTAINELDTEKAPLNSPTLVTPTLGVASATSINKVAITAPATSATLTIADGATLTVSASSTVSGTNTGDQTNITGNAATVTVADAGGDTTTFPLLGTSATGSLSPATDAGLTYNATTNALSTTTFIGALTGNADTATLSSSTSALKSATTTVNVDAAAAPTNGQVLTATSGTTATWQNPASGFADPMTTRGDIIIRNASNTTARLGVGTNGQVLTTDGTNISWGTVAGSGDVVGPGSATDNAIARFDLTTGKLIQNSSVTLNDSGQFALATTGTFLDASGASTSSRNLRMSNTGANLYVGVESSTGGAIITGSTAYDAVISSQNGISFSANDGGAVHMRLSSTILALGGTQFTSTKTGAFISNTAASTSGKNINIQNTSGQAYFGVESSVGGTDMTGSTAYDTLIGGLTAISFGPNGTQNMRLTPTGLTVTGTLNVTGHPTLEGVTATGATGTGNLVFATSPSLTTPTLGVASATSINKVAITAPATSATLTIADGKTLTASNTLTFTGTDSSSVAFGTGGTVLYSGGALGTPSSGTLTNCTSLPISGLTASTVTAIGVGSIELGHASDTTITRVSAGKIAVEGVNVGYLEIPQNSQSAAYTTVLADSGKHILHPSADTTARTFTIDSNANVAYPIGTAITFINQASAGTLTIAITSDTMRLAGAGTTGSRTLAANGIATAIKVATTEWIISGTNLT